jgi:signal transduction histidine kinase
MRAGVMGSYRAIAVLTAVVSGLVTIQFARLSQVHLGYAWPALRPALETSGSLIALFATFLVFGRLRRRMYVNELLLACALAVLALSNLLFVTVPTVAGWAPDDLTVWAAPLARSLGAVLFVLASFAARRELRHGGPVLALAAVATITALGLATLFARTFAAHWAPQYAHTSTPVALSQQALRADPKLFAFELLVAVLYGLSAIGFLNLARRRADAFYGWLAAAGILAVVSHVNYSLFPQSYSQSVLYTGDVFRFAFYVALLAGCVWEIWSYWTAVSAAAVLEDRRRMARDLHDGLAQELAYISRNLDFPAEDDGAMQRLRLAVDRAQCELRSAIGALAPQASQAAGSALAQAASQTAERFRIGIDLDIVPDVRLSPTRAEALIRVACEAIANAARHSGASRVTLRLERYGSLVRMRVADRGCGFDTSVPASGFGLVSMRERIHSVGGDLSIRSDPGRGSEVEVAV